MSKLVNKNKIFSPEDKRDYNLDTVGAEFFELPNEYIPEKRIPITNQMASSSCVSHALSTVMSYCELKKGLEPNIYSKGFIYANRNGVNESLEGMYTRDAIKILHKEGDCQHHEFRWHMSTIKKTLEEFKKRECELQEKALPFKLKSYNRLYSVEEIKQAVYQYGAAIICYPTRKSNKTFIEPADDAMTGSHAIACIGWTKEGYLILQNSWGKLYGDKGIYYMTDKYDWREAWALQIEENTPRNPAPQYDYIPNFFHSVYEFLYWLFHSKS